MRQAEALQSIIMYPSMCLAAGCSAACPGAVALLLGGAWVARLRGRAADGVNGRAATGVSTEWMTCSAWP
jgi:hypothetical protein